MQKDLSFGDHLMGRDRKLGWWVLGPSQGGWWVERRARTGKWFPDLMSKEDMKELQCKAISQADAVRNMERRIACVGWMAAVFAAAAVLAVAAGQRGMWVLPAVCLLLCFGLLVDEWLMLGQEVRFSRDEKRMTLWPRLERRLQKKGLEGVDQMVDRFYAEVYAESEQDQIRRSQDRTLEWREARQMFVGVAKLMLGRRGVRSHEK